MTKKFVVTGAAGSGKSTLLKAISGAGFYIMKEVAEYLIEREMGKGGKVLPQISRDEFQKRVLQTQRQWEQEIPEYIPFSFQDRGIPDGIAFYLAEGLAPPEELKEAAREARYDEVLILDPNPRYENTKIRRETQEKSLAVHHKIWEVYRSLGYNPIRMTIEPEADRFWRTITILDNKYGLHQAKQMQEVER